MSLFSVRTVNTITRLGLKKFGPKFQIDDLQSDNPDTYIIRSQDLHSENFPNRLKAIARAGTGTNNIPIPEATAASIEVFNTPYANANANGYAINFPNVQQDLNSPYRVTIISKNLPNIVNQCHSHLLPTISE